MLASHQAKRIKAVAVVLALGCWILPVAIVLLVIPALREAALASLAACAFCWAVSMVLAWPVLCPWCCERLFFATGMANSPGARQILRQFVPYETVVGGRFTCPHCHSRFTLRSD